MFLATIDCDIELKLRNRAREADSLGLSRSRRVCRHEDFSGVGGSRIVKCREYFDIC